MILHSPTNDFYVYVKESYRDERMINVTCLCRPENINQFCKIENGQVFLYKLKKELVPDSGDVLVKCSFKKKQDGKI